MTIHDIWNDPVWSKVIGGLIVSLVLTILAAMRRDRFKRAMRILFGHDETPKAEPQRSPEVLLGEVSFDYLPHESPFQHGWKMADEERKGAEPVFSYLPSGSPVSVGLSVVPTGWYGLDYVITEAHKAGCNRLKFAANFGTVGRLYTLVQIQSRTVGQSTPPRWVQMGVNFGPACLKGDEGVLSISGMPLKNGWQSFDISLDEAVDATFGRRGFQYGKYGKLQKIRLRGPLSISSIRLCRYER